MSAIDTTMLDAARAGSLYNEDLRPFPGIIESGAGQFRSLMDLDVCLYPDLHAGFVVDRR